MVPSKRFLDELAALGVELDETGDKPVLRQTTGQKIKVKWVDIAGLTEDLRAFHSLDAQADIEAALLQEIRVALKDIV